MTAKTYVYGVYVPNTDVASATARLCSHGRHIKAPMTAKTYVYGVYVPYKDGASATAHVSVAMEDILKLL